MSDITKTNKGAKKRKPLLGGIKPKSPEEGGESVAKSTSTKAEFVESINTQLSKINFLNAKYLPLSSIQLDPNNPRELSIEIKDVKAGPKLPDKDFDDDVQDEFREELKNHFEHDENKKQKIQDYFSIALLASTIRKPEKLMQPICVYEKGNRYIVLAGERRTLAHYVMNAQHIAANIMDEPQDKEKAVLQYIENSAREDLPLKDKVKAIRKILHYYGTTISVRSLANILKLSKSQAQKYAKICKEENMLFKRAIESGVLSSPEDAYNLIKNNDADTISNICNLLLKGKGIEEIFKQMNTNSFAETVLVGKRIMGSQESGLVTPDKRKAPKNDEQFIIKSSDIPLLKQLIQLSINAGALKGLQAQIDQLDMSSLWEQVRQSMKKAT